VDGRGDAVIATVDEPGALKAVDLYSLCVEAQTLLLIGKELLDILALVALQLDHLAHLRVGDDGSIAGKLLLDDFEYLLLVEFLGEALHRRQGLATIALCVTRALARGHLPNSTTTRVCSEAGEEKGRGKEERTYVECEYGCSSDWRSSGRRLSLRLPRTDRRT
jgi:hypothetical protein